MKKAQFKKLKIGDRVFLKSVRKIKTMKEFDGNYFEDGEGVFWSRFLQIEDLVKGEGAVVIELPSYHKDVVTVEGDMYGVEIPRKCIKNF